MVRLLANIVDGIGPGEHRFGHDANRHARLLRQPLNDGLRIAVDLFQQLGALKFLTSGN
jgi:hypothetical protein